MREIKFRVWDTRTENWIEGIDLVIHTSGKLLRIPEHIILQQYTGLKDRKGRDIYEGDIVACLEDIGDKNREYDYVVELDLDSPAFLKFLEDGRYLCKVIGNIYETPELLEVRDERD